MVTEIHSNTSAEILEELKQQFRMADTDGSGMIDKSELQGLLESTSSGKERCCEHWLTEEEVDRVMEMYDVDKNGFIDFDEFVALAQDGVLLEGKLSEYKEAFNAVDMAGSGAIGAVELAQLFVNLGQPMAVDQLQRVFAQYDKDTSGRIEFGEFLGMFRNHLLDLRDVLDYIHTVPDSSFDGGAAAADKRRGPAVGVQEGCVAHVTSEEQLDKLLARSDSHLTVLFAGLSWCRPCKGVHKPFESLADRYRSTHFVKLLGNANDSTKHLFKNRLKIRATPSFFFFRNGSVVHSFTGANKVKLETKLRDYLLATELSQPVYLD